MSDWNNDVVDWNRHRIEDYVKWVTDTYGAEEAKKLFAFAQPYRAVMDVQSIDLPKTEPFTGEIKIP